MPDVLELSPTTVHMAIDMQNVFAEDTAWRLPHIATIVPSIARLAQAFAGRTLFTRFVTPSTAREAKGRWRRYYEQWPQFTGAAMDPDLVEVIPALRPYATPDTLLDKLTYSAFDAADCAPRLDALGADTLLFTGVETDVCVLATLLAAVDRGYNVIAVADALASSSQAGHDATLDHVLPRLPDQVEIVTTADVLAALNSL
jgi:nicotinamidase-related amidase